MLAVFFGDDRKKVRDAATEYIDNNLPENASLTTIEAEEYQAGWLSDALGVASLFGGEEWFVLDRPSQNGEYKEEVESALADLEKSPNTFIVLEDKMLATIKKRYDKHAVLMREFTAAKAAGFNNFALADALAGKDKRRLWLLYQEACLSGVREEEVIGILWWQLKTLRLAKLTSGAKAAGMKEFPYNKAKRSLVKFADNELERLSDTLLALYHDSRAGRRDMDIALEKWILKL